LQHAWSRDPFGVDWSIGIPSQKSADAAAARAELIKKARKTATISRMLANAPCSG
jgi:hypothetical protein